MLESLSRNIKVLSTKIEDRYYRDVSITSTIPISRASTPVDEASDDLNLHKSLRECVNMSNPKRDHASDTQYVYIHASIRTFCRTTEFARKETVFILSFLPWLTFPSV